MKSNSQGASDEFRRANQIINNVVQSKEQRCIKIVKSLQEKWIGYLHIMNYRFLESSGITFSKFGSTGRTVFSTAEVIFINKVPSVHLLKSPVLVG